MSRYLRSGKTILTLLLTIVVVAVIAGGAWLKDARARAHDDIAISEPSASELDAALRRVALSPESLAAAGLDASDAAAVVNAARQHIAEHKAAIAVADDEYAAARRAEDQLRRRIQSGRADAQEIKSYDQVKATLQSARSARAAALDALFKAAVAELANEGKATLERIRANASRWSLPPAYFVLEQSEEEWITLRDALANERIAAAAGDAPDPAMRPVLLDARSDPKVALARTNLDANLNNVTNAWKQTLGE